MYRLNNNTFVGTDAERLANNFDIGSYFVDSVNGYQYVKLFNGSWLQLTGTTDPLTIEQLIVNDTLTVVGTLTATHFSGDGASITNLDGGNLQSGSVTTTEIENGTITEDDVNDDFLTLGNGAGVTLSDVTLHLPFNYAGGMRANTNGHLGQAPTTESGSIVGVRDGAFGSGAVEFAGGISGNYTNKILNPVADDVTTGVTAINVTVTRETSTVYADYDASFKIVHGAGASELRFSTDSYVAGATYTARIMVKEAAGDTTQLLILDGTASYVIDSAVATGGWVLLEGTKTISGSATTLILALRSTNDTGTQYAGLAQVTETSYQLPFRYYGMNGVSGSIGNPSAVTLSHLAYGNVCDVSSGSISCWVKTSEFSASSSRTQYLFCIGNNHFTTGGMSLWWYSGVRELRVSIGTNQRVLYVSGANLATLDAETYHLFVLTWNESETKLYIDGNDNLVTTVTTTSPATFANNGRLAIGGRADLTTNYYPLNGEISDLFVSKTALSATTIKAIYNSGVPIAIAEGTQELAVSYNESELLTINDSGISYNGAVGGIPYLMTTPATNTTWTGYSVAAGNYTIALSSFTGMPSIDLTNIKGVYLKYYTWNSTTSTTLRVKDSAFATTYFETFGHRTNTSSTTYINDGVVLAHVFNGNLYIYLTAGTITFEITGYLI